MDPPYKECCWRKLMECPKRKGFSTFHGNFPFFCFVLISLVQEENVTWWRYKKKGQIITWGPLKWVYVTSTFFLVQVQVWWNYDQVMGTSSSTSPRPIQCAYLLICFGLLICDILNCSVAVAQVEEGASAKTLIHVSYTISNTEVC